MSVFPRTIVRLAVKNQNDSLSIPSTLLRSLGLVPSAILLSLISFDNSRDPRGGSFELSQGGERGLKKHLGLITGDRSMGEHLLLLSQDGLLDYQYTCDPEDPKLVTLNYERIVDLLNGEEGN